MIICSGSDTEASLRLTWVDGGLRVDWAHPAAKLYIVRHRQQGSPRVDVARHRRVLDDLDDVGPRPVRDYTVEVISYVYPAWRTWNSATIEGTAQ